MTRHLPSPTDQPTAIMLAARRPLTAQQFRDRAHVPRKGAGKTGSGLDSFLLYCANAQLQRKPRRIR